jgi:NAD+ kinase
MVLGITGNTGKDPIWLPIKRLLDLLGGRGERCMLAPPVAEGLLERGFVSADMVAENSSARYFEESDVVLSFGGDGTLLNTVYEIGNSVVPILGVNMGRLGFLAIVDDSMLEEVVDSLIARSFGIDERSMLHVASTGPSGSSEHWALNEVVIARSGVAGLLTVDVQVDDVFLNSYWADGLIIATPTGSTAYSLSAGGPIISPGSSCLTITPLAPHSLTERPIIVPMRTALRVRVRAPKSPYVYAVDGRSTLVYDDETELTITASERVVRLVALPGHHYFETLRSKLMWGSRMKGGE